MTHTHCERHTSKAEVLVWAVLTASIPALSQPAVAQAFQEAKAMCATLARGEPLVAKPIGQTVADFRGKQLLRDKYDDAASIEAKTSTMLRENPILGRALAVSFAIEERLIQYDPGTRTVSFPLGAVDDGCASFSTVRDDQAIDLLRHSTSYFDEAVCATEVLSKSAGQSYTGINSYGATTTVQVVDSSVAGIYVGLGAPASSPLFNGKSKSSMRSAFTFELSPDRARQLATKGEIVVVVVPRAPFYLIGKDATRPTMVTPYQERRSGDYLAAEVACSAMRDKASGQIFAYHDAVVPQQPTPAKPRGTPSIWLLGPADVPAGVVFNLAVDENGRASGCVGEGVAQKVEKKACAMLMMRARFTPALNAEGQPMPGTYRYEHK